MSLAPLTSFCFNDTATTDISPLSLQDPLPISPTAGRRRRAHPATARSAWIRQPRRRSRNASAGFGRRARTASRGRSEEHTSELQSHLNLVCRLLLEKQKSPSLVQRPFPYHIAL